LIVTSGSLPGVTTTRVSLVLTAFALAVSACTGGAGTTATTPPSSGDPSSTTAQPDTTTTTVATLEVPITASDSLDDVVVERMRRDLAEIMVETEEVRGLPFLSVPTVVILDQVDFTARVAEVIAEELDEEDMAIDSRFLSLLGMVPEGTDLYGLFIDLYTEQVAGYYDGEVKELVVPAAPEGFTPLQRIVVIHELVHALTDQHFEFNDDFDRLSEDGNGDDAAAMLALVEGDASHAQFVYMEGLSPLEAVQAAVEAFGIPRGVLDSVPAWMRADLLFPYEQGLTFTEALIAGGGLAAVDQAYQGPPMTTEQVLDHAKYVSGEGPLPLPAAPTALDGWELYDEGSLGEWGLRLIVGESVPSGEATQAAAGWGNDEYRVYSRDEDVAVVLHYIGDSERDAEEITNAFIAHIRISMNAGPAVESGDGLLYDQAKIYVFLDRVADEMFLVASTDKTAGADLRAQLGL
jgi:hypothetical protein